MDVLKDANLASVRLQQEKSSLRDAQCPNCLAHNWPRDTSKALLTCTGCNLLQYCSSLCQKEHWKKVHKPHCPHLAISRIKPPTFLHTRDNCKLCLARGEPCHVAYTYKELVPGGCEPLGMAIIWPKEVVGKPGQKTVEFARLPFPLGEVSGVYHCQAEHVIAVLQQIQYDIKNKEPGFYKKYERRMDILRKALMMLRMRIFAEALVSYNKENLIYNFSNYVDLTWKINEVCSEIFKEELRSGGKVDVWGQFMIFLEALNHWFTFVPPLMRVSKLKTKTFVKADMSEIEELARNQDRAPVLTSLLAAAEGPLPSFKFLLDLCSGGLQQGKTSCVGGCRKRFTVEMIIPMMAIGASGLEKLNPVLDGRKMFKGLATVQMDFENIFCCGRSSCVSKIFLKKKALMKYHLNLEAFAERFGMTVCDACFLGVEEVHRCSGCWTKLYCGKKCAEKDWGWGHREACSFLKGDKRREKEGGEERQERGAEAVKNGMATAQSLDGFMDVINTMVPGGLFDMESKRREMEDITKQMKNL